jgi:hypothetical protein
MTSSDGAVWTSRTSAADNTWQCIAYGNGLFVAVSSTGEGNRVMTSSDGTTWDSRPSAADNSWLSVTYGNGLYVAVSASGANRVMTSSDGTTWASRSSPSQQWSGVTYGNGLFVAVAPDDKVMTSSNGINWSLQTSAVNNQWASVIYGSGLFVAVSRTGRVMTSFDGTVWASQTSAADNQWQSVCYGDGLFVAVSSSGVNRLMSSSDGINWTSQKSSLDIWRSITYGNNIFVAVSASGRYRVMTGTTQIPPTIGDLVIPNKTMGDYSPFEIVAPTSNSAGAFTYTSSDLTVATIVEINSVQLVGAGTTTITANQAANGNYTEGSVETEFTVSENSPTIGDLVIPNKTMGDYSPFVIVAPTSNSAGVFTYTSSDLTVATIVETNSVQLVGAGTTTITANQAANGNYTSGSVETEFSVSENSPSNPAIIGSGSSLVYFLGTGEDSVYANIDTSIVVTEELLLSASYKVITISDNSVTIVKNILD